MSDTPENDPVVETPLADVIELHDFGPADDPDELWFYDPSTGVRETMAQFYARTTETESE